MPEPTYTWDQRLRSGTGAYRNDQTGQIVEARDARIAFDSYIDNSTAISKDLAISLQNGRLSLADWQTRMASHIKDVQINAAINANGGRDQMTRSDWGRTGQLIKQQYQFLDKFAEDIASGKQPLDGRFVQRSQLYTQSGETTRNVFETVNARDAGMDEERSLLEARDNRNCEGAGSCPGETNKGWQPIGTLIPIGNRICNKNCRCHFEYRNSVTGEVTSG